MNRVQDRDYLDVPESCELLFCSGGCNDETWPSSLSPTISFGIRTVNDLSTKSWCSCVLQKVAPRTPERAHAKSHLPPPAPIETTAVGPNMFRNSLGTTSANSNGNTWTRGLHSTVQTESIRHLPTKSLDRGGSPRIIKPGRQWWPQQLRPEHHSHPCRRPNRRRSHTSSHRGRFCHCCQLIQGWLACASTVR